MDTNRKPIRIGDKEYDFLTAASAEMLEKIQTLIDDKLKDSSEAILKNQNFLQISLIIKLCNELVISREKETYTNSDDQKIDQLLEESEKFIQDFNDFCSKD